MIFEPASKIPVMDEADVVVVGGGPAGISASVSAKRNGVKKVVLLERYGHLGGMATGGLVLLFPHLSTGKQIELQGMSQEWLDRLAKKPGGLIGPRKEDTGSSDPELINKWRKYFAMVWADVICYGAYVDPEMLKIVLNEMAEEAKVDVYFHCWGAKALVENDEVKGLKAKTLAAGKNRVDCTGDGISLHRRVHADKSIRNSMLAVVYRIGNVDYQKFAEYKLDNPEEWSKHNEKLNEICGFRMSPHPTSRNDVIWVNNWIPNKDCLKVKDLTAAEFGVRRTLLKVLDYLKKCWF